MQVVLITNRLGHGENLHLFAYTQILPRLWEGSQIPAPGFPTDPRTEIQQDEGKAVPGGAQKCEATGSFPASQMNFLAFP